MTERRASYVTGAPRGVEVELFWPDPALSPNAQKRSWYYKEDARKCAKENAFLAAKNLGVNTEGWLSLPLYAEVTFHPPNKRHRDLDNLLAAMKPDFDGLCSGLGIDDSRIKKIILQWGDVDAPGNGGIVVVKIGLLGENA